MPCRSKSGRFRVTTTAPRSSATAAMSASPRPSFPGLVASQPAVGRRAGGGRRGRHVLERSEERLHGCAMLIGSAGQRLAGDDVARVQLGTVLVEAGQERHGRRIPMGVVDDGRVQQVAGHGSVRLFAPQEVDQATTSSGLIQPGLPTMMPAVSRMALPSLSRFTRWATASATYRLRPRGPASSSTSAMSSAGRSCSCAPAPSVCSECVGLCAHIAHLVRASPVA